MGAILVSFRPIMGCENSCGPPRLEGTFKYGTAISGEDQGFLLAFTASCQF